MRGVIGEGTFNAERGGWNVEERFAALRETHHPSLITRHAVVCFIAAAAWICAAASWAQNYPSKPVRYVIPFDPGTSPDIVGRVIADRSGSADAIVDYDLLAPLARETIGSAHVARSSPDG